MEVIARYKYCSSVESKDRQANVVAALEDGRVVFVEDLPFAFTDAEKILFGASLGDGVQKNITLDPYLNKVSGVGDVDAGTRAMLAGMLSRYRETTQTWLRNILGDYADNLEPRRCTYRPVEIAGRKKIGKVDDRRAFRFDDTLLHPDAFKRRPMQGNRILRMFTNVNPDGKPRIWKVGHGFEAFAARYVGRIRKPRPGEFAFLKLTRQTHWPRTHYDHIMLNLHDRGKMDREFQAQPDHLMFEFPAGATWFCFTDQALHAAIAGACCLEQTYELKLEDMAAPEKSPLRILERLKGRPLI